jgi:hypothetical protein
VLLARPDALALSEELERDFADAGSDGSPMDMDGVMPAPMGGAFLLEAAGPPPIRTRTDFSALALFAAAVTTDADGRAAVPVKVPDNLTRYRVLAVATDGVARFGVGESSVTARLPLMIRPSAPRFLAWGDTFELPVVVQNQTDVPLVVDVAVRAGNASLTGGAGRRLVVPGNDRVEVRFPAATATVGQARFEVAAVSGSDADAATVTLPTPRGTLSARDAESACRALWSDGILPRESVEFQVGGQRSGDHDAEPGPPPGPDLVVCTLPDGRPGVLPGDESACASSGIDPWKE